LWFYDEALKPSVLAGGKTEYRLRRMAIIVWLIGVFAPIALAFLAHAMQWEAGATSCFGIAVAVGGIGGAKFWGETSTAKRNA
jgi:hypothetical protein